MGFLWAPIWAPEVSQVNPTLILIWGPIGFAHAFPYMYYLQIYFVDVVFVYCLMFCFFHAYPDLADGQSYS